MRTERICTTTQNLPQTDQGHYHGLFWGWGASSFCFEKGCEQRTNGIAGSSPLHYIPHVTFNIRHKCSPPSPASYTHRFPTTKIGENKVKIRGKVGDRECGIRRACTRHASPCFVCDSRQWYGFCICDRPSNTCHVLLLPIVFCSCATSSLRSQCLAAIAR
jgi:hypothetical protein